ncbi:MAG: acetyltransferase [Bryobacteraceae bacterium]|nr:acetyltransferase [Bryobacteraceae bacterium]
MRNSSYRRSLAGWALLAWLTGLAHGQIFLNSTGKNVRLVGTDEAVLEAGDPRTDLPCAVVHPKPVLGFDLRFHARYEVTVPMRELAGAENLLSVLFRVTPLDAAGKSSDTATYFVQKLRVPQIDEEAKGDALIEGSFDVGEGKFKVEWLMRDRAERVCSDSWEAEASLPSKDKEMSLMIPPARIAITEPEQFRDEPPVAREGHDGLAVKVLVNFAPQNARSATLQPFDTSALVSILRSISRDPRIARFSIVAFNMHDQKVLYKQEHSEKIDFPAIGKALESLKLGTVDLARLANKHGETEFLEGLLKTELASQRTDAVIFAGPKALLEQNVSQEALRGVGPVNMPVFYMNYNLTPQTSPWRDSIGHAVKFLHGIEYTISRPRDLWYSVSEMVSQIAKHHSLRASHPAGGQ